MSQRAALLASLAALSFACTNRVTMADDVQFELHFFGALTGPGDTLHSPYVTGASIGLFAMSTDSKADTSQWRFVSSNPSVFAITRSNPGASGSDNTTGRARAPGSATLTVVDASGNELDRALIEVKDADSAQVQAHGPLILGKSDSAATVSDIQLLAGGTSTFLVRYFAGGVELSGNGVLTADGGDLVASPRSTEFSVSRDWLELTAPLGTGPRTVSISANGRPVATLAVNVVDSSSIDQLQLEGQDESGVSDGTWLSALAEARDGAGKSILGVDYKFHVDGQAQEGSGDLYRYQFESGTPRTLSASVGGNETTATIHAGAGYVASTNQIGCTQVGARGGWELLLWLGLTLAMGRRYLGLRMRSANHQRWPSGSSAS